MTVVTIMAVGWLFLALLGWAVLAPLRDLTRRTLLPAAPLLGAALLAAGLSTTSWFVPVRVGVWIIVALAGGLVVLGVRRGRRPWRVGPGALLVTAATVLIGAVGAAVALIPTSWVGDGRALSANPSHDVYYYVAEASWLHDHTLSPIPDAGSAPGLGNATPAFAPMAVSLRLPMRVGQPMVNAALDSVLGTDAIASVMAVMALWVLLVAPAAFVAGRLLRMGRLASLGLAVVSATSAILLQQVYQQNVDALLGIGLALLTIAACLAAAERRIPVWPAALLLAGLVSVYTELGVFVGPAVLGGLLLRHPRGGVVRWRRAGLLLLAAVALAPTAWARGVGALLVRRDGDAMDSPLFSDGWGASISRVVGTSSLSLDPTTSRWTVLLAVAIVLGWVLAVALDRYRGAWLALLAAGLGYVTLLTEAHHGYTQMRSVSLLLPLLLVVSVAGWAALLRRVRGRSPSTGRRAVHGVLAAVLVLAVVVWAQANLRAAPSGLERSAVESRHVDQDFTQAAQWVSRLGGAEGADVTVLAPDLFAQMWLAYELRDDELVSYASLRPDYLHTLSYWAGEPDRYFLVGRGAALGAPPEAVVGSNSTFTLVDTTLAPVVAAVPTDSDRWYPFAVDGVGMAGPDTGRVTVATSAGLGGVAELELTVPAGTTSVRARVQETGEDVVVDPTDATALVPVTMGDLTRATVEIDLGADGVQGEQGFGLEGVRHVG